MGLFLSKIWGVVFGGGEVKVVIVGLNNAGKTTTLYKMHLGEVVVTNPTIGSNVEEIRHKSLKFQAWDLGGQEALRSSWGTYYESTQAVIFVVDSTDRERVPLTKVEFTRMLEHEELKNSLILVFANKQDVKGAMNAREVAERLALHTVKTHDWHIQPCCALSGEGLTEGFDWLVQRLRQRGYR